MFWHVGSFFLTTLTTALFIGGVISFTSRADPSSTLDYLFKSGEIFITGLFLASISLLFIMNSLLNEELAENAQQENRFTSGFFTASHTSI